MRRLTQLGLMWVRIGKCVCKFFYVPVRSAKQISTFGIQFALFGDCFLSFQFFFSFTFWFKVKSGWCMSKLRARVKILSNLISINPRLWQQRPIGQRVTKKRVIVGGGLLINVANWFALVMRSLGVYFLVKIVKPKLAKRALQINVCSGFCFSFPCAIIIFIYFSLFFLQTSHKPFYTSTGCAAWCRVMWCKCPCGWSFIGQAINMVLVGLVIQWHRYGLLILVDNGGRYLGLVRILINLVVILEWLIYIGVSNVCMKKQI